jgi:Xaa-Pro aminopeptidase
MRKSMLLEYPVCEYEERQRKLLAAMEDNGFEAVIFTSKENTRYFCGLLSVSWKSKSASPGTLIVTKEGSYTLAGSASARGTMEATSCVEDIRGFHPLKKGGMPATLPKLIYEILAEKKIVAGKIGMELGSRTRLNMPVDEFRELMQLCGNSEFVDCGKIFWPIRVVKTDRELVNVRKVCEINYRAFENVMTKITEGMTEYDVYRSTLKEMLGMGAQETYSFGVRAGKERYGQPNCTPSDRPIGRGEMILMDGGLIYKGFYSDIIRQAIIGKPNATQKRFYEASVSACEKALEKVKPGNPVGEICRGANEYLASGGFSDYALASCGHGLGLDIHEFPNLDCTNEELLVPGMVIAVEPSIYIPGEGMFGIEENVVVTETGYELLTPMTRRLIELD